MAALYNTFYYATVCHVCKCSESDTNKKLKRCGGCKLISYCSSQHQKTHWPLHKKMCKCIQSILTSKSMQHLFQGTKADNLHEWSSLRSSLMLLVQLKMVRKLSQAEQQMFMFPRVCELCREAKQENLEDCQYCYCVSYCSTLHQQQGSKKHNEVCKELSLCLSLDKYFLQIDDPYSDVNMPVYRKSETLPGSIDLFITEFIKGVAKRTESIEKYSIPVISEFLTCPLTLLYALEKVGMNSVERLKIHVVGASFLECTFLKKWETILHFMPNITYLNIVFIGPELGHDIEEEYELCEECKIKEYNLDIQFLHNTFYHDYAASEIYSAPDIIIAYNCGLHEYEGNESDSWFPSLPYLIRNEFTPLILTSYTQAEAKKDIARIIAYSKDGINTIVNCEENPYSSKRPYRDWNSENKIFFQNKFINIVKHKPARHTVL